MTIIAGTGHRDYLNHEAVFEMVDRFLEDYKPEAVVCGMAAGFDLQLGQAAISRRVPLICARPWTTHSPRVEDREVYSYLIEHSEEVYVVTESETYPGPWVYHRRNEWMVDSADEGLACWDGRPNGGTFACLNYFAKQEKSVLVIDPGKLTTSYIENKRRQHEA